MITKINNFNLQSHKQKIAGKIKMLLGLVMVILKIRNYSRVWQILKKNTGQVKKEKKKKRCIASSDLFSPPSDVPLMLMTDFLQRTALNRAAWQTTGVDATYSITEEGAASVTTGAGATYPVTGRELCVGDGRSGCHVVDHRRS